MSLRIAIFDHHAVLRDALRVVIARQTDMQVVGEAADSRTAYQVAQAEQPDVILIEVALRGLDGISVTRELCERDPRSRVLVLSMYEDEHYIARALGAGARGYSFKTQPAAELFDAIRVVGRGEQYLPPSVSRPTIEGLLRSHSRRRSADGPLAPLSNRERDVFALLVRGASNDVIATNLCISVRTVESHRAHIFRKLHLHSMAELLRFAANHHLLDDAA